MEKLFKEQCVVDYLNCYFEVLAPVRETEGNGADCLALNLLIILHRIFQKLSTLTNSRKHSAEDIRLVILCDSDMIACLGLRELEHICSLQVSPFGMVH